MSPLTDPARTSIQEAPCLAVRTSLAFRAFGGGGGAGAVSVVSLTVVVFGVVPRIGSAAGPPSPPRPASPTTTSTVTATITASATTTKFDSIRRLVGLVEAEDCGASGSSAVVKRELYSSR